MLVQAFTQTHGEDAHGRDYLLSYEGYIHDDGETNAILAEIYAFLNRDDRPNRKIRPSLSVGDIITLFGGPRSMRESHEVGPGSVFYPRTFKFASMHERIEYQTSQRTSQVPNVVRIPRG
jgi:hypothetical protein